MGRDDGAVSSRGDIQHGFEGRLGRLPVEFLARAHMAVHQEIERRRESTGEVRQPTGWALVRDGL